MKKKLIIAVPVLLLVLGVAAKMFLLAPPPPDEKKLAKEPGPVYEMAEPFVVNLADGGETPHFAKVGVALRLSKLSAGELEPAKGEHPASVEDSAQLRDIVISTLQRHTSSALAGAGGRAAVKAEITRRVNRETELRIVDVYYTEFAVQ